jgi:hypothetical protein
VSAVLHSVVHRGFLRTIDGRYALENVYTTTINCSFRHRVPPADSGVFHVLLRGFIGVTLRCFFRNVQFFRNVCAL